MNNRIKKKLNNRMGFKHYKNFYEYLMIIKIKIIAC